MKRIWLGTAIVAALLSVPCSVLHAQAAAPAATIEPSKTLDSMFSSYEKQIVPLVEAMPEGKFDFAPSAEDFKTLKPNYTGVRTFRQEVMHLTQSFYFYGSATGGTKPDAAKVQSISTLKTKAELVAALKDAIAYAHMQIATLTTANAWEHAGRDPMMTRATAAASLTAHGFDHYGQLVEYLRMNGVVPPASDGRPLANPAKKM